MLAIRLGVSWVRLRRILSDRRLVVDGPAPLILAHLEEQAGLWRRVKLSATTRLEVPIAIGIIRPEICVPRRALEALDHAELETMLAHELAHLVRRDPAWRLLAGLVCRVFFFQPLNRLVAARLETASEMLCDDWAVEHTDRPLALARCLTEVAGWIAGPPLDGSPVPAMARGGSGLGRRVRRLLAAGDGAPGGSRRERWFVPLGCGLVALLVFAAPGATDTAPRPARVQPPVPPIPGTPAAAAVPPDVQTVPRRPVQGDLRRLLTQLRSGQRDSQDVGDWIALAQAMGSPGNTANLAQIFNGGLDLDLDVDVDVDVSPDGSIDIHIRPKGTPQDPDPDQDDSDPNFFDFDLDFDQDFDADDDDDDEDEADEDADDHDDEGDDEDEDEADEDDDDDDGDCSGSVIHIPDIHVPDIHVPDIHIPNIDVQVPHISREQIREIQRQAREAARQAREQARQARQQAHDAARQARDQAEQVRQHVQREMQRAAREMQRAQREQHEALRDAWRQMRQQRNRQRFAVPPPAPPIPPKAPRPPRAPRPPTPPVPPQPLDPFDGDSN